MKKTILIAGAMVVASVSVAVAGVFKPPTAVPEIEALAGVSAVAAVAGAVALIRERWKR